MLKTAPYQNIISIATYYLLIYKTNANLSKLDKYVSEK